MPSCSVKGCKSRYKAQSGISFFRFPLKDKQRLKLWISAVGRDKWTPTATSKMCSLHFSNSDFMNDLGYKYVILRPEAVPSHFIHGLVVKTITNSNKENAIRKMQMQPPNTTEPIKPEQTSQIKPSIQQDTNCKIKDDSILQTRETISKICETVENAGNKKCALIYSLTAEQKKQSGSSVIVLPVHSNCMEGDDNSARQSTRADVNKMTACKQSVNKCIRTNEKPKTTRNAESFHIHDSDLTVSESSTEDSVKTSTEFAKTVKIKLLDNKITKLSHKVKILKQKIRRQDEKIKDMATLLNTLLRDKNFIEHDSYMMLKDQFKRVYLAIFTNEEYLEASSSVMAEELSVCYQLMRDLDSNATFLPN